MKKSDTEILYEIYSRAYAASTPQGDFYHIMENAELGEMNQKVIPYKDYELDDKVAIKIIKDVLKENRVPTAKYKAFKMAYYLGCSPKSKINN